MKNIIYRKLVKPITPEQDWSEYVTLTQEVNGLIVWSNTIKKDEYGDRAQTDCPIKAFTDQNEAIEFAVHAAAESTR